MTTKRNPPVSDLRSLKLETSATPLLRGGISRREAIRIGVGAAAGLFFAGGIAPSFAAQRRATAKSVIQIWMWGGPCHLDTFDPKPDAGNDFTGPLASPIATNVDGIRICELLPGLAKHADKYSLVRSLSHGNNGHETASYITQTGRTAGTREVFPGSGAVVSLFKGYDGGYKGLLPPYIVLTELQGRFSEAGFLGNRYKPFATGGDPGAARFVVEGVISPSITEARQRSRRELLHRLNTLEHAMKSDTNISALAQCEQEAYEMILGDAGKVFDLSQEKDDLRERYGRNTFGQSCLMARRLVERGVPYVTINYKGWDTHKQHFQTMRRKLPELDKGLATLLDDLAQRGLLGSTIIWCGGEFGRTPKVQWEAPWNGGRNHYGKCFSALVAGGGFKGGHLVGASDKRGEEVAERLVHPCDLIGSMYELLGIDSEAELPNPQGLKLRVLPGESEGIKRGGLLREIMA